MMRTDRMTSFYQCIVSSILFNFIGISLLWAQPQPAPSKEEKSGSQTSDTSSTPKVPSKAPLKVLSKGFTTPLNAANAKVIAQEVQKDQLTQKVIDGIQQFYAQAHDFTSEFQQIFTYKIYNRTKKSKGQVFFKKPGKMRWDYQSPTPRLFIADGQTLWVYEPEAAQVFKRDLSSAQLPVALRFMKGEGKLSDDFDIVKLESNETSHTLTLNPKDGGNQEYKQLQLVVSKARFEVQESILIDPVGNTNQIVFKNVKINQSLPDVGFQFTPPQGVNIVGTQK